MVLQAPSSLLSLSNPTWPDAASACPTLALAAPTASGAMRAPWTAIREPASVGSPSAVPVPWSSSVPTSSLGVLDRSIARMRSVRCAEPLGAVKLADRPS